MPIMLAALALICGTMTAQASQSEKEAMLNAMADNSAPSQVLSDTRDPKTKVRTVLESSAAGAKTVHRLTTIDGDLIRVSKWENGAAAEFYESSRDADAQLITVYRTPGSRPPAFDKFTDHLTEKPFTEKEVLRNVSGHQEKTVYRRGADGIFHEASHASIPNNIEK